MRTAHVLRALKLYAIVTLIAADGAFAFGGGAVPQPKPTDQAPPAAPRYVTTHARTLWLLFVDDLHLDFVNTGGLREVLRAISSELIHDGDVFAVRSSRPSSISIDLTSDRRDVVVWDSYWTTARNSLRVMSEQTGGFAQEDGHDLVETLARIRSAMRE
jgi:hypothetical protein